MDDCPPSTAVETVRVFDDHIAGDTVRKIKPLTSITVAIVVSLLSGNAQAEWRNALKPRGEPARSVKVVEAGKPSCAIQCPARPTGPEKKAAADLQHWIKEMTGATLEIATDGVQPNGIAIRTDRFLGDEGYRIAADNGQIILSGGKTRGIINAVYALLEEDLGCRFYTNDSIRLPKSSTLTVAPIPRSYIPKLILRDPFYFVSFNPVWSLRNRTNAPVWSVVLAMMDCTNPSDATVPEEFGGHVDYGGLFVHTHAALLPPDKYFKDHPEYFAQDASGKHDASQLCATNPDTARIVTENVLAVLAKNPHTEIVSISKNDSSRDHICHCERCRKLRAAEGSEMANQLALVNYVAEVIEKSHSGVLVDTLAYLETIGVPKTVRPRKNVIIRICNDGPGAWTYPFTPARICPIAEIVKKWSAVHDRLSIWDYNINFSHFLAPMPNMDVIADNIRFWVDNHAVGVLTQGGYQSTSERDEMRSWVIAKLMWDPSLDVNSLVEDFTLGHYGPAGPILMEYEALLAASRKEHAKELEKPIGIRYPMTIGFLDKDFLDHATRIFDRAEQAAGEDETILHRVERAELPILYVKLSQGPVTAELLDSFERIARREKVDWLFEMRVRLEQQLATWQKQLPPP